MFGRQFPLPFLFDGGQRAATDHRVWAGALPPQPSQRPRPIMFQEMIGKGSGLKIGSYIRLLPKGSDNRAQREPTVPLRQCQNYICIGVSRTRTIGGLGQSLLEPVAVPPSGAPGLSGNDVHDLVTLESPPLGVGNQENGASGGLRKTGGTHAGKCPHLGAALD